MSLKYNTKQRNKSIQGLRSFKDTLPTKIKKILIKKGHIYSGTLDNWKYIVGEELFKVCYPKSFKNSNKLNGSCLNIMVKRGSEVDLEYSKKTIKTRYLLNGKKIWRNYTNENGFQIINGAHRLAVMIFLGSEEIQTI